jgi:hypothetical protein
MLGIFLTFPLQTLFRFTVAMALAAVVVVVAVVARAVTRAVARVVVVAKAKAVAM